MLSDNALYDQLKCKEVKGNTFKAELTLEMLDNAIKATKPTEITLHKKVSDVLNNTEEV